MSILYPNKDNFKEILKGKELLLVDFFATWCGPCNMMSPIIDEIAQKYNNDVRVAKVDIDENEELAGENNIEVVPTIIFYKSGVELGRLSGVRPIEEFEKIIIENKKQ